MCHVVSSPDKAVAFARRGLGLGARVALACGLLVLEKTLLNLFVDFESAQNAEGLGAVVRVAQHWGFRFLVSFVVAAALFGYLRAGSAWQEIDAATRGLPLLRPRWLLAHLMLVLALVPLSGSIYGHALALPLGVVVAVWVLLALLAMAALFAAFAPTSIWQNAIRALHDVWGYSAVAAVGAAATMVWSQSLWSGMARVTFETVYRLLGWLMPSLQVDPANRIIDTGRFAVSIDQVCSGLEGMGLMVAFCSVLLLLFRRDLVFPRALLLVPAGILLSFALNIVRIAVLVLIGDAGYPKVAVYGFHSQAGWIAFNAAAVCMALLALRSPWFAHASADERAETALGNPAATYLVPYMALVVAGMLSRAMSEGGLERFYDLRLLFGAGALWYAWPKLRTLHWGFTWRGVFAGLALFVLWIVTARLALPPPAMPEAFTGLSPAWRNSWIIGHIVVTVALIPVVEELAFRGYLLRRARSADFESLRPGRAGAPGLIVSTAVYALCQGAFWLPGMVAGIVFGLVYMRTGRLGESVAAHVTVNVLLAAVWLVDWQWYW